MIDDELERGRPATSDGWLGTVSGHLPLEVDWYADGLEFRAKGHHERAGLGEAGGCLGGLAWPAWLVARVVATFAASMELPAVAMVFGGLASGLLFIASAGMIVQGIAWLSRPKGEQHVKLTPRALEATVGGRPPVEIPLGELNVDYVQGWIRAHGAGQAVGVDLRNHVPQDVATVVDAIRKAAAARQQPEPPASEAHRRAEAARLAQAVERVRDG